jgi:ATP/maltotriose-dependent transcriptional regulator MalT
MPRKVPVAPQAGFAGRLAGSAELGLGNHERALRQLLEAKEAMDRHMAIWDWYWRTALESALTEAWLTKGIYERRARKLRSL